MALIFLSSATEALSGCVGDCMTCHPKLENSPEHSTLKTCAVCHDPAKPKLKLFALNDGCGDRCFICHSEWPKDSSHAGLNTCLECHDR